MKKILIILVLAYSFAFSARFTMSDLLNKKINFLYSVTPINEQIYDGSIPCATDEGNVFQFSGNYYDLMYLTRSEKDGTCYRHYSGTSYNFYASRPPENNNDPLCLTSETGTTEAGYYFCSPDTGAIEFLPHPSNGQYDNNGDINCNDGYGNLNGTCTQLPQNSEGFEEDGTPKCSTGYTNENGFCIDDPSTNPDGTCKDGYTKIIGIGESGTCQPDSSSETGETGTGGEDETGTGGSTGGTGGEDETGTGGSTGGTGGEDETGTGDTSGGGSGGTSGTDGNPTNPSDPNEDSDGSENDSSFTCTDGAPSQCGTNLDGSIFCHCDRTCEAVNYVTNIDGTCSQTSSNDDDTTPIDEDTSNTDKKLDEIENSLDTSNTFLGAILSKLSELVNIFKDDGTDKTYNERSDLQESKNKFNTFYSDMQTSLNNITTQVNELKTTIENGLQFNPITKNNNNLQECLTVTVFGETEIVLDFITPLSILKPIFTILIQISMLVFVVQIGFKIFFGINNLRG